MLIAATNFGGLIGGLGSGFLVRSVPYWYLFLITLVCHRVGFVLYCLSHHGWLMMISRLISGYFIGSIITLTFSYCTVSSEPYAKVKNDLGEQTDENLTFRIRNYLFSAKSFGHGAGVIIAAGKFSFYSYRNIEKCSSY